MREKKSEERRSRESTSGFAYEREESTRGTREEKREKRKKRAQHSTEHALLTILLECHVIFARFA